MASELAGTAIATCLGRRPSAEKTNSRSSHSGVHDREYRAITDRARIIQEWRREAFETETRRAFSQARQMEAYVQSVEDVEREKPRRARRSNNVAGISDIARVSGYFSWAPLECNQVFIRT